MQTQSWFKALIPLLLPSEWPINYSPVTNFTTQGFSDVEIWGSLCINLPPYYYPAVHILRSSNFLIENSPTYKTQC